MKRISKLNRGSELIKHLMATMVVLASLLILPNTYARVGDVFTQDKIQYTVTSEGTLFKRVSVTGHGRDIVIANIPPFVIYNDVIYSVTAISNSAFQECNSLTNVTVPDSVTTIGEYAFFECENLTDVIVSDSVTTIRYNAFENCVDLRNISLGNGLEKLENMVFHHCSSLTSIKLPASLKDIGWGVFNWCTSMKYFEVDENSPYFTTVDGILFNKSLTHLIKYPAAKEGTEYVVSENVTELNDYVFHNCHNLQKIVIPAKSKKIPQGLCEDCRNLKEFTIPASVTSIGSWAFSGCEKLKNITAVPLNFCLTNNWR